MPKTKLQKQVAIRDIEHGLKDSKLVVMTSYEKMPVSDVSELRRELNKEGISYSTVKKTLLKKVVKDLDDGVIKMNGNLSLAYGKDEVMAAKVLAKFKKDHDNLQVLGGWLENAFISKEKVDALSKLLGKQELLGKLVGTLNAPISGFVNVLSGNMRGLVNVLNAIKDGKN